MAALTHDTDKLLELEADTRRAWSGYTEALRELTGEEYERAERESWTKLQDELRRLEQERQTLTDSES